MSIAIALATCNGAKFLSEQLESLSRQTRLPDQVVISDDSSVDDTLAIVKHFQRSAPYRVDVLESQEQIGPMGNFLRAAQACEAQFIAFCDQDDVWQPSKLELCERALEVSGSWAVIHSIHSFRQTPSGRSVGAGRVSVPSRTVDGLQTPPNYVARGMSMVVRKTVLAAASRLKELWEPRFKLIAESRPVSLLDHWSHAHDMFALTVARLLGTLTYIGDVLAYQRVHANNYSNGGSSWRQSPEAAESLGHERNHGYLVLGRFCEDFAEMLKDAACLPVLSEPRKSRAREYYRGWSDVWRTRAKLHAAGERPYARIVHFMELCTRGGYRGNLNGGLGRKSQAKDVLAALGLRVG